MSVEIKQEAMITFCLLLTGNEHDVRFVGTSVTKFGEVSRPAGCQMSLKVAQNDFSRKIKYFYTSTKIAEECGRFGQINVAKGLEKLPKV